jgi:DNA-binding CsgD family transcriptional regulator
MDSSMSREGNAPAPAPGLKRGPACYIEASVVDTGNAVAEADALGFVRALAGERRARTSLPDPTSFLMDDELVVRCAGGESILRLPWFDDDLFVGRQLPDISEMPANVRLRAVEHYLAALRGQRGSFAFVSYGHAYRVDAIPVRDEDGRIAAVLGVATPTHGLPAAAVANERPAQRLERSAAQAEQRAERHRAAGRGTRDEAERARAARSRTAAERARAHAQRLRAGAAATAAPVITPREADVLTFASHGLTSNEIAEQLVLSPGTVRTHFENVYLKLGVSDKAAAVATALRHGLIE